MCWRNLFAKNIVYGIYEYQVYINKNTYEIMRYGEDEAEVVMRGRLFRCENDKERIDAIIEDVIGLATQMREDADDNHE